MADLSDIVQGDYSQVDESTLCFETIPIYKIILLSILTLGIYQIIWFYKNWKILQIKFGYKVSPFWRSLFAPLTNNELFPILNKYVSKFNVKSFDANSFAFWYLGGCCFDIIFNIGNYLKNKDIPRVGIYFSHDLIEYAIPEFITWSIISFFITIPIIARIQARINKVNKQNFSNVSKTKLYGITTVGKILIGKLIPLTLHILILALVVYTLYPINSKDQCALGDIYIRDENFTRAYKWYEKSATQGNEEAQCKLAMMYEDGKGITQDLGKAYEWYRESMMKGNIIAQYKLAMMYEKTKGITADLPYACVLYKTIKFTKSIIEIPKDLKYKGEIKVLDVKNYFQLSKPFNTLKIQSIYEDQEFIKSRYLEKKSIFSSHSGLKEQYNEQCKLGVMYEEGIDVPQDLAKAYECYQQAASQGSIFAKYMLGVMYEEGKGVAQNFKKACEYYRTVAEQYIGLHMMLKYEF